jgi:LmbE family N-acetylglucosaminyl deacetylase
MTGTEALPALPEDWGRALAIVAHPDDLEYGAASAIARWTGQGKWVGYLLATAGEAGIDGMDPGEAGPLRQREERAGAAHVGVATVEFLDHRDGVIEEGLALRRDLARAIRRHRPDVLVLSNFGLRWGATGPLNMADHRVVGIAALDAARDAGNRWIFPELLDEGLEPWSGVRFAAVNATNEPTHAVDVTATIDRGVASLREHHVYLAGLESAPDPDVFLREHAAVAGGRAGCAYAVDFEMVPL